MRLAAREGLRVGLQLLVPGSHRTGRFKAAEMEGSDYQIFSIFESFYRGLQIVGVGPLSR